MREGGEGFVRMDGHPPEEPDFIVDQAKNFVVFMKGGKIYKNIIR